MLQAILSNFDSEEHNRQSDQIKTCAPSSLTKGVLLSGRIIYVT